MKHYLGKVAVTVLLVLACTPQKSGTEATKDGSKSSKVTKASLTEQADKISYMFGVDTGKAMKRENLELNEEVFLKGLHDALAEGEMLFSDAEMQNIKREHSKKRMEMRKQKQAEAGAKNRADGNKYLEENKKKEGVTVTESGLQYRVLTEGKGPMPKATDKVSVHYKGSLIDGTEFDSSYKRKKPAQFPVNRVVKGWTEALQLMPVGSKWELVIPSDLAYGSRGAGRDIGPDSVLIFEVELLEISEPEKK